MDLKNESIFELEDFNITYDIGSDYLKKDYSENDDKQDREIYKNYDIDIDADSQLPANNEILFNIFSEEK